MRELADAVQQRILTHYAAGTELSSIAAILHIDRDDVLVVVERVARFDRSLASSLINGARPARRPRRIEFEQPPAGEPVDSKYRVIAAQLREAITGGQYPPGSRFPGENQLAAEHSVSRKTAANALQLLKDEGLLTSRGQRGTFVTGPAELVPPAPVVKPEPAPEPVVEPVPEPEPVRPKLAVVPPAPDLPAAPERLGWWDAFLCRVCGGRSFLPNDCCGREPIPVTVTITRREVAC